MRNLVLVHLESLNMLNYRMNASAFPTLYMLEAGALAFEKYYSTATSTIMVMTDLAYGGLLHDESCGGMLWNLRKQSYSSSFFDRRKEDGYRTLLIKYTADTSLDTKWANEVNRFGVNSVVEEKEKYSDYLEQITDFLRKDGNFVLLTCTNTTNVSYNYVDIENTNMSGIERWKYSYKRLDNQLQDLMTILEDTGHVDDTTIVLYGDHGDDLYQHGLYGGLSHAVEPFDTLIHTPLFIVDSRIAAGKTDVLVDTTMLSSMMERLLEIPDREITVDEIADKKKEYVISRNLYAAQLVRVGSFEKSYAITDGEYLLMAGNRGMRFFHTVMDPVCQHNLLRYYVIDNGNIRINERAIGNVAFHFKSIFDSTALNDISERVTYLRDELIKNVKALYTAGECLERMYEIDFDTICKIDKINGGYSADGTKEDTGFGCGVFEKYYRDKNVILYGAGKYGEFYYRNIKDACNLIAWVDKNNDSIVERYGISIQPPQKIFGSEYDVILIAIQNTLIKQEVHEWLISRGIDKTKII